MPPSNWLLWDRIREFARGSRIYQQERIFQDQSSIDRIAVGGEFLDFSSQSAILEQTNLQINRLERYKDYEQMDQTGEVSLALDLYADNLSLIDPEHKHSIIIRAEDRKIKEELEELYYETLLMDRMTRPMARYLCKFGDCAFEVVTDRNRSGVSNLRFMNIYNFTRIETRFGDLVGFFYQDELYPEPIFLHPWSCMHLRLTSFENLYHPYGRCESFGTRVFTPTGYKNIEDFCEGDKVYVFDGRGLVVANVMAACYSGKKEILRIKTRHCTNECSKNHPVMVRQWIKRPFEFGEKWFSELIYKRADELRIGDELVIPKMPVNVDGVKLPEISTLRYSNDNLTNTHVDHLHSGQHRLSFPRFVDKKFAELFGFLTGDGWLNQENGNIRGIDWALGECEKTNSKYELILRSYGLNPRRHRSSDSHSNLQEDVCKSCSVDFGLLMAEMGLCSGFDKKRVPDWVYNAKPEIQEAFIHGVVDSDGSTNIDEWNCERIQLELSNYELTKDIKMLLHQIGWKCGNIIERHRETRTAIIHGREYDRSDSWIIYFYRSDLFESADRHVQRKSGSRGYNARKKESEKYGDDVVFEPIISIEDGGIQETADIQVDHLSSNFVADGVVVHNSILDGGRKAFKQLRLMEDAALIYRITRAPEKRKYKIPVGMIPAKEVPEYMQAIARMFKRQRFYNPTTGTFDERYSPIVQEDDFFLPQRPDGSGPDIDTLPGAENLDQIADIEYFKKKMIAPLKIPFSRVGIGEGAGEANDKSLSQEDADFAKAIQWIQSEMSIGLTKIGIIHLALRGYPISAIKGFEISLAASSAIEDLYRMETWQTRTNVMADLKDIGWFPKEWIVTRFTDMSPDEIQELEEMEEKESGGGFGGGGGGGGGDLGDMGELGGEGAEGDEDIDDMESDEGDDEEGGDDGLFGDDDEETLESHDYGQEKRLITEINRAEKRHKSLTYISKLHRKRNAVTSLFSNLMENKELDGLTKSKPTEGVIEESAKDKDVPGLYDPNKDEGLLVEWSVPKEDRDGVIFEVRNVLVNETVSSDGTSGEIIDDDLPS